MNALKRRVHPPAKCQETASEYREGGVTLLSHWLWSNGALMRLEPYDGKLSSTVLRGGRGSNVSSLPDIKAVDSE